MMYDRHVKQFYFIGFLDNLYDVYLDYLNIEKVFEIELAIMKDLNKAGKIFTQLRDLRFKR